MIINKLDCETVRQKKKKRKTVKKTALRLMRSFRGLVKKKPVSLAGWSGGLGRGAARTGPLNEQKTPAVSVVLPTSILLFLFVHANITPYLVIHMNNCVIIIIIRLFF